MANKTQATRQKLVFRLESAKSKPRKPLALMKQTGAGSHRKTTSALRAADKRGIKKLASESESD